MSKKLNTASITNELAESAFFRPSTQPETPEEASPTPLPQKPVRANHQENQQGASHPVHPVPEPVPVPVREGVPPPVPLIPKVKRAIRQRQPFDIYEDQFQRLKKIAEQEKGFVNGRGMSQMVREAIDKYLKDHASLEE
jgi:hypothetical protein